MHSEAHTWTIPVDQMFTLEDVIAGVHMYTIKYEVAHEGAHKTIGVFSTRDVALAKFDQFVDELNTRSDITSRNFWIDPDQHEVGYEICASCDHRDDYNAAVILHSHADWLHIAKVYADRVN